MESNASPSGIFFATRDLRTRFEKNCEASCDICQLSVLTGNHVQRLHPAGAFLKPIEYSIFIYHHSTIIFDEKITTHTVYRNGTFCCL